METKKSRKDISPLRAIKAKCHDCMAFYEDGRGDCGVTTCPLYSYMPFAKKKPILDFLAFSPTCKGLKLKTSRPMSDEQKEALAERMLKAREARLANIKPSKFENLDDDFDLNEDDEDFDTEETIDEDDI